MHPLERCGFVRDTQNWFNLITPGYAIHVYIRDGGWGAGIARDSEDFKLTDLLYQVDRLSEDVVWGKRVYSDPVAAALAAVEYSIRFGFIAECQDEMKDLRRRLLNVNMDNYTEELSDAEKRKERVKRILE